MENSKIVKDVILRRNTWNFDKNALAYKDGIYGINYYMPADSIQLHLHFTSKDKMVIGDWVYDIFSKNIAKISKIQNGWFEFEDKRLTTNCSGANKIVASTDRSLGLPIIPTDWIRNVYAPSINGNMTMQISLPMVLQKECYDCHNFGDEWGNKFYDLKLDDRNEICISTIVSLPVDTSLTDAINIVTNDPNHPACVAFDHTIGDKMIIPYMAKTYFVQGWIKSKTANTDKVAKDA